MWTHRWGQVTPEEETLEGETSREIGR